MIIIIMIIILITIIIKTIMIILTVIITIIIIIITIIIITIIMIIIIIINYHSHHNHHHFIINVPVETCEQEESLSKCFDIFLHIANFFFVPGNRTEPNLPENWNSWFSQPIVEAGQANCVQFLKSRLTSKRVGYKINFNDHLTYRGRLSWDETKHHPP